MMTLSNVKKEREKIALNKSSWVLSTKVRQSKQCLQRLASKAISRSTSSMIPDTLWLSKIQMHLPALCKGQLSQITYSNSPSRSTNPWSKKVILNFLSIKAWSKMERFLIGRKILVPTFWIWVSLLNWWGMDKRAWQTNSTFCASSLQPMSLVRMRKLIHLTLLLCLLAMESIRFTRRIFSQTRNLN